VNTTYAIKKLRAVPVPTNTKVARSSFSARATRVNLLNFSFNRGTRSKKRARNIPMTATKTANPDNPADKVDHTLATRAWPGSEEYAQGPILKRAWKLATLAKQHIARKPKKA